MEFEEFEKSLAHLHAFPARRYGPFLPCPTQVRLPGLLSPLYHPYHVQARLFNRVPSAGLLSSRGLTRMDGCPLLGILPPRFFSLEKTVFSYMLFWFLQIFFFCFNFLKHIISEEFSALKTQR